jgi:hypothetical protein
MIKSVANFHLNFEFKALVKKELMESLSTESSKYNTLIVQLVNCIVP